MRQINNEKLTLALLIILGFILRIFMLDSKPFWFDEIYSVETAKPPLMESLNYFLNSSPSEYPQSFYTPPLYYVLLHLLMNFNDSNFAIRFVLSVIPSVMIIAATYKLTSMLFDKRIALLSTFIVSISPLSIVIAQLARPYALHTLFTLMSLLFFYKSLETNEKSMWALFAIFNTANTYTHYYAFFVILAETLYFFIFVAGKKETLLNFLLSLSVIVVAFIPWAYVLAVNILDGFSPPPSRLLNTMPLNLILSTMYKLPIGLRRTTLFDWKIVAFLIMPFFYFFFIRGFSTSLQKENKIKTMLPILVLLTTVSVPILIWIVSRNFLLLARYFWFLSPLYFMFVANGIYSMASSKKIRIALAFISIAYLYLLYDYYFLVDKNNWALLVGV